VLSALVRLALFYQRRCAIANSFINGKLGLISVGGANFATMQFDFTETLSDLTDITYTVSGGATFAYVLPGYNMCAGTLTFVYDTLNQPVLSTQSQIPGQSINLVLYPDGTKPWVIAAIAESMNWGSGPGVKGPVVVKTTWKSNGAYTRPTS
jgi:hypothetical protein